MNTRTGLTAVIVALAATAVLAGQIVVGQPGQIPRPGPRGGRGGPQAPEDGTAVIRGLVIGGDAGQPLRRAVVRLFGQEMRSGRVATTDEQGHWEMRDLPAGRFNLAAMKAGYVTLQFGQRRPFEQGRPIELRDGQTLENIDFNLPRGAVIAGHIVDEFGEPVAEAAVSALRYRYVNGRRRLVPAGRFAQTDDLGSFRLYGLAPGDYYLSATLRAGMTFFGAESDDRSGYAPTYYPGTGSPQQAQRITLGLGTEMGGLTFSLLPVRTVKISGRALDSQGRPLAGAFVMLTETSESAGGFMMMGVGGGNRVRDDGSFTLSNVSPGEYSLQAQPMNRGSDPEAEVAMTTISVGSEDISGVMLVGSRGATLSGQIVFDAQPQVTVRPTSLSLMAIPRDEAGPMGFRVGGRDKVDDDWTFELGAHLSPVVIRTGRLPPGYALKSVLLNGQDVTDSGISFRPNETVTGLQVMLTARPSSLSGTVTDGKGNPAVDYAVVVFADDPSRWGHLSRYQHLARPDQQGGFTVADLPPGNYLAAAVEYVEDGQHTDPEFLERLRPSATAVTIGDGERRSIALELVKAY